MSVTDYHTIEKEKKESKNRTEHNPATVDEKSVERNEAKKKEEIHGENVNPLTPEPPVTARTRLHCFKKLQLS